MISYYLLILYLLFLSFILSFTVIFKPTIMWQIKDPVLRAIDKQERLEKMLEQNSIECLKTKFLSVDSVKEIPYCSLCKKHFKSHKLGIKHFNTKTHIKKQETHDKKIKQTMDKYVIPDITNLINDFLPKEETFYQKNLNLDKTAIDCGKEYFLAEINAQLNHSRYKRGANFFIKLRSYYSRQELENLMIPFTDIPISRVYYYNHNLKTQTIRMSYSQLRGIIISVTY